LMPSANPEVFSARQGSVRSSRPEKQPGRRVAGCQISYALETFDFSRAAIAKAIIDAVEVERRSGPAARRSAAMISFRSHARTDAHRVSEQFPAVSAQSLQSLSAGSGVALKQFAHVCVRG